MNLAASARRQSWQECEAGYAMAALLIAMSVMAILLTVALPTWRQTIQREKEEELIFRGNQYSRAISAYQRKYANASPQTLDVLVEQHYLRKKFKDPVAITEDGEFQPLYVQTQAPGTGSGSSTGTQAGTAGTLTGTVDRPSAIVSRSTIAHRRWPIADRRSQRFHHRVVKRGTDLLNRIVVARGMHAIGEKHHVDIALGIDPQRRPRETRMAERRGRHLAAA